MTKPKILILTGDAAESLEVMYPYQRLQEEGYEVKIARRHTVEVVVSADCCQDLDQVPLLQCHILEYLDFPGDVLAVRPVEPFL